MRESAVKVFDPPLLYRWTFNDLQSLEKDWTKFFQHWKYHNFKQVMQNF